MRVRMLKNHEVSHTHPEHGALSLIFGAGTTQHFDDTTADALIAAGKAEAYPEDSRRVKMLRTITELELAELINAKRERNGDDGRVAASRGQEAHRYRKGELVHFPDEAAAALIDARAEDGSAVPVAELAPDEEYAPCEASKQEAIDAAVARVVAKKEADAKKAEQKAKLSVANTKVPGAGGVAGLAGSGQAAAKPTSTTTSNSSSSNSSNSTSAAGSTAASSSEG